MSKLSIIELHPFESWDGPAIHVRDLIKGLVKAGHEVCLVTRDWTGIDEMESLCEVRRLPLKQAHKIDLKYIPVLANIIKEKKADIIHTHGGWSSWIALFATLIARRGKVVNTWHGFRSIKRDFFHRWFYDKIAAVIAVSEMLRNRIIENGYIDSAKVHTVLNGIDIKKFTKPDIKDVRQELGISRETFVVGYVGRIHPDKGLEYAVKAIDILKRQNININFLIVGGDNDIEYKKYLQDIINAKQLNENIKFCGFTSDVPLYMKSIDALILPSVVRESFGLVLCEAMICSKPVITTNTGGQQEIVEDGITGFIVKAKSEIEIAAKLKLLATNEQLCDQMGERGKKVVEDRFSFDTMARNTLSVFKSCK